jgi:hypothetical protein
LVNDTFGDLCVHMFIFIKISSIGFPYDDVILSWKERTTTIVEYLMLACTYVL